ncbi:MAG: hypothetical protein ACK53L_30725, partial [Pirellulaceae bacterium]
MNPRGPRGRGADGCTRRRAAWGRFSGLQGRDRAIASLLDRLLPVQNAAARSIIRNWVFLGECPSSFLI